MISLFDLAYLELEREGKLNKKNTLSLMLRRAIKIRKYLDLIKAGELVKEIRVLTA